MIETNWSGKRVCFLGDSITEGVGGLKVGERYFDLLGAEFGFEACGYGVNGASFLDLLKQAEKMHADHGDDVDAIFILAGTNNYYGAMPLGNWFDESVEIVAAQRGEDGTPKIEERRTKREFSFDKNTFRGSINTVMSYIRHHYATKQIVLMTPIHRAFATFGPTNIQYSELYSNSIGLFIGDYVGVVREASSIWSTELIDLHRISGLFPLYDESAGYFLNSETDRLHPNQAGNMRMARAIASKLPAIALY